MAGDPSGRTLLVACSGGPDSLALADILARLAPELGFGLVMASFDHGLRPEAAGEVAKVRDLAERWGVGFVPGRAAGGTFPPGAGQDEVRRVRLDWLADQAEQTGADWLALGHQADDRAETVVMRLIRGAGLRGLTAIRPVSQRHGLTIVRPLIRIRRAEIETYLRRRGLEPVRDPSNQNSRYFRSRVRQDILPRLARENPNITAALNRLADLATDEDDFLDGLAAAELDRLAEPGTDRLSLGPEALAGLHPALARRVIRLAVARLQGHLQRLEAQVVEDILVLASRGKGRVRLPGGLRAWIGPEGLVIGLKTAQPAALAELIIPGPGRYRLSSGAELVVEIVDPPFNLAGPPERAVVDAARAPFPLQVRSRRAGDRLQPLGGPGRRKISDIFIDAKVPAAIRETVPVIEAGGRLIWLAGLVLADEARITDQTQSALEMTLITRPS